LVVITAPRVFIFLQLTVKEKLLKLLLTTKHRTDIDARQLLTADQYDSIIVSVIISLEKFTQLQPCHVRIRPADGLNYT